MAYSKIILNGETLMDVTSDTVAAGSLLSGKTATKNDGTKVTGNIASKTASDLTASGATVTAAAGYYPSAVSKAVTTTTHPNPTAAIASSTGVVTASHTQETGYVTGGTTTGTLNLTTKAAATINTSTADQTIASYRWLTGTQTIKSVTTTNLTAANIASGVVVKVGDANNASRIAQVTGTYAPAVSSVTVTPTETTQTFNATGVYGYKPVTVNGISSTYVGTGIARKSSADVAFASATATFTAPIGYYSAAATKTLTTQAAQTIYPSTADQTVASYRWLTGNQTIKSVVTSNLTAENIAEGVVIKIGDANNASRITQVTGTYEGGADLPIFTITYRDSDWSVLSITCDMSYNECLSKYSNGEWGAIVNCESASHESDYSYCATCQYGESDNPNGPSGHYSMMNYDIPFGDGIIGANITYYENGDIEYVEPYYTKSTLNVTANGTYSSYFSLYDVVNVNTTELKDFLETSSVYMASSDPEYILLSQLSRIGMYRYASRRFSGAATSIYAPYVEEIDYYAFFSAWNLKSIYFPICSRIKDAAFSGCGTIETISFPSCQKIGSYAFQQCSSLTTVSFPECSVIYTRAFSHCSNLQQIYFPKCTTIDYGAFMECKKLQNADFPLCTIIENQAFMSCSSLTTASFPECSVINIDAFHGCVDLATISFPVATTIGSSAFQFCYNLTAANFPVVTSIGGYAFQYCSSLTTISFPEVTTIDIYAFQFCRNLTAASFPVATAIGSNAFYGCSSLTTANFPVAITINSSAFYNCYNLMTASFPEVTTIGSHAFSNCYNLTTASFPKVIIISSNAFCGCSGLTAVSFPVATTIDTYAFYNCYNLTTVNFPVATTIGSNAFHSCSGLTTANFPAVTTIGSSAFRNCYSLTTASFPVVTTINYSAFYSCHNLISLYLNSVSAIPTLGTNPFWSTPISTYSTVAGRYGSIFVPSSLYTAFTTATGWTAYSARMVSV